MVFVAVNVPSVAGNTPAVAALPADPWRVPFMFINKVVAPVCNIEVPVCSRKLNVLKVPLEVAVHAI